VRARDGRPYHRDERGHFWRTYRFIEGGRTYEVASGPRQAFESGKAFGRFQSLLADLPGPRLHETIPDFHHTPKRLAALQRAIEKDARNRAAAAGREIEFALRRAPMTRVLEDLRREGRVRERVVHNDTKFNNVVIDEASQEALCVVDLDTVMPGLVLHDFGDMVRTLASPAAEDERDLSKVEMRLPMFEALTQGYLSAAGGLLAPAETELLAFSGKLVTLEVGLRFLTDFLEGDVYFKIGRPEHNLERCRAQFALVEAVERAEEAMRRAVERLAAEAA
jgi:aminoglycoside phosphotransferase (APT) family kinase protein